MSNLRFDWRWVVAIVVLLAITNSARLPWPVTVLVVGGGGGWLLAQGWRVWARGGGGGLPTRNRVTYWRGQRIELEPQRRGPALPRMSDVGPAAIYLLLGGVLVLAALAIALQNLGI